VANRFGAVYEELDRTGWPCARAMHTRVTSAAPPVETAKS